MSNDLSLISRAQSMLAEAKTLPELKAVVDVGHTAIEHAKRLRIGGYGALCEAAEIVLRAERRLGSLLDEMDLHGGDRKSRLRDVTLNLSDLGISKMQSSRWQAEARVDDGDFESWLSETIGAEKFPTSGALIKLGRQQTIPESEDKEDEHISSTVASLNDLVDTGQKFNCIYADPPWKYGNQATRSSTGNHYGTMTIEEICNEPVLELASDDCHLYLWTTASFLPDAFRVITAWGFEYKSNMVWVKPQMGIGNYVRLAHEHLLIGIRGNRRTNGKSQMSWIQADRTKHSRKPRLFRECIEHMSPGPYLELYGRETIEGWTIYGNQIERNLL